MVLMPITFPSMSQRGPPLLPGLIEASVWMYSATLPLPAFPVGQDVPDGSASPDWTSWTPYTYPFNMTQQPALSVPCGFTGTGLPVGLQIVGPRHADALVLRVGQAYQSATDWHRYIPKLMAQQEDL